MAHIIDRLTERLAATSSRRGFLDRMGKVVAGASAAAAGIGILSGFANAPENVSVLCCHCPKGDPSCGCPTEACPSGTYRGYNWYCCTYDCPPQPQVLCQDCYNNSDSSYNCTYAYSYGHTICPC